ncbi:unnamed protein product [Schistosoma mattheei]|uniref:Uncharacterized protein n=1 Tax=Schistosoma mattheei TaxID=31246 RepID=A0A183NYM6_9TREM|nr:unnamed protein product [Schistosoma mattheei]
MKNVQSSHDKENQFSVMKISTSEPIIANDTATTSTNATPGNNFSCLNQTIIDIENILYKNCIELSQHETKLITLLERSEAMEKNFKHGIDTYIVNTYPEKQCGTLMVATNRKGRTG